MRLALVTTSLALTAILAAPAALAGTQQERMTQCNADAKTQNLSGDARKAFMSSCLSGKTQGTTPATPATPATPGDKGTPATPAAKATPATPATQQDKMKSCNKEAGDKALKGDERKAFMSSCLKG
jgi:hypothetical protein